MKKIIILIVIMLTTLTAATTPGVLHFIFSNGEVTTSGDDTFYEFDIQAYLTGTDNSDDLKLGTANIYVEYDTTLFGASIAGTTSLEYEKIGVLAGDILVGVVTKYDLNSTNNTFSDVFSLTPEASTPGSPSYYDAISTDSENPSGLFHIKMKAKASGEGEVSFPNTRINDVDDQFWALDGDQYNGPHDYSAAVEPVNIEGPITGEPFTSIELLSMNALYKGGMVRMKWKTASETENLGFIIKRALIVNDQIGAYEEIDTYLDNDDLLGAGTTNKKTTYLYFDKNIRPGRYYAYVLEDIDYGGFIRESEPVEVHIPESHAIKTDEFVLTASYPNPFNPAFVVPFELYKATLVDIKLYDVSGRLVKIVANKEFSTGSYTLMVDGSDLSSGVYLLKTRVDNIINTQKMLLVK